MNKELKKILTSVIFHNLRILYKVEPIDSYILNYRNLLNEYGDEFFDIYHLAAFWGSIYNPKRIMEIGSRTGLSLVQLLSTCLDYKDKRVVLFDLWDDGLSTPELIKKYLDHLAIPTDFIEFYKGDSLITVPEFKKTDKVKFDWILCDGSHEYDCAKKDLENIKDMVAQNGVLVMDDISSEPSDNIDGVKQCWDEFKIKYAEQFEFHENLNGKGVGYGIRL